MFEGEGSNLPPIIKKLLRMDPYKATTKDVVEAILEQADLYGLRGEVITEATSILKENPNLDTGSAYLMAAIDWDL